MGLPILTCGLVLKGLTLEVLFLQQKEYLHTPQQRQNHGLSHELFVVLNYFFLKQSGHISVRELDLAN